MVSRFTEVRSHPTGHLASVYDNPQPMSEYTPPPNEKEGSHMKHPRSLVSLTILALALALACNLVSPGPKAATPARLPATETANSTQSLPTQTASPAQPTSPPIIPTVTLVLPPTPLPPTASAAPQTWQPAGFGGAGNFDGVWFDASQPGVVYAASDVTGIFRSMDYGDHWEMRSLGLGNYEVSSFAVDPFDHNTLYAGAGAFKSSNKAGMYISHDAGLTWQPLPATLANTITFRRFRTTDVIAPDPAHRGVILSGSRENGLWRTTDGGLSWMQVYTAPLTRAPFFVAYEDDPPDPHPAPVSGVAFDPGNPNLAYAGLDGFGVIQSADGGISWKPINIGLPASATVKYLAVGRNHVLYAAVGAAGVYRSLDGGRQWQAVNGFGPDFALGDRAWASSVAVHPTDPDIAYVSLATYDDANVWKTTDGGTTWAPQRNVAVDPINNPTEAWSPNAPAGGYYPYTLSWQVTIDPNNPNRLFYVNYWGILRSEDGGEHWRSKIAGAQNTCVTALALDTNHPASQPDKLFATHWDAGILASGDQGRTWTAVVPSQVNDPALSGHYWNLAIVHAGGRQYYYTTADVNEETSNYGQVLRSNDGVEWTPVFSHTRPIEGTWLGGFMLGLAVDPTTPTTLYVTQDSGQVYTSSRNGEPGTWSPTAGQPAKNSFTYALAVDAQHRIFAGTVRDGLWRSTDGGASWQSVSALGQSTVFHLLAVSDTVYAAGGDSNLYRSPDGGDTWQALTQFSAADDGDGVGDQGMAIAVDPRNPDHILFSRQDPYHSADGGLGLVESTDGGRTWRPINAGLGNLGVTAIAIDWDGNLFAGTACGGVWYRPANTGAVCKVLFHNEN
jgi:xyloglucan-specific exo-beta-1,4-glucanase